MDELGELHLTFEGDFVDLDFPLASYQRDADGVQQISSRGLHMNSTVGFSVRLGPSWDLQELENADLTLYWGRAEIVSLGTESDAFMHVLDEVYGTGLGHTKMRNLIPFLAVSLAGNPVRIEHEPVKMKLFFESDVEERDAEFYLNIDLQTRSVQFHEKDTDYRRGVLLALSAEA